MSQLSPEAIANIANLCNIDPAKFLSANIQVFVLSKDGSYEEEFQITQELLKTATRKFPLNEEEINKASRTQLNQILRQPAYKNLCDQINVKAGKNFAHLKKEDLRNSLIAVLFPKA